MKHIETVYIRRENEKTIYIATPILIKMPGFFKCDKDGNLLSSTPIVQKTNAIRIDGDDNTEDIEKTADEKIPDIEISLAEPEEEKKPDFVYPFNEVINQSPERVETLIGKEFKKNNIEETFIKLAKSESGVTSRNLILALKEQYNDKRIRIKYAKIFKELVETHKPHLKPLASFRGRGERYIWSFKLVEHEISGTPKGSIAEYCGSDSHN